jgi:hypothetical protein
MNQASRVIQYFIYTHTRRAMTRRNACGASSDLEIIQFEREGVVKDGEEICVYSLTGSLDILRCKQRHLTNKPVRIPNVQPFVFRQGSLKQVRIATGCFSLVCAKTTGYNWSMIKDETVLRIMQRTDLNGKEMMLLIYLLSREPEPEKETDGPVTTIIPGMAKVGPEQVESALKKGFHRSAFKKLTKGLKQRGFLEVKADKGGVASRYRVKFPQKQPKKTQ